MVIIKLSNHVDHLQANFESMNHSLHAYKQEHDQNNINILEKNKIELKIACWKVVYANVVNFNDDNGKVSTSL
jgi:hypothetical protein